MKNKAFFKEATNIVAFFQAMPLTFGLAKKKARRRSNMCRRTSKAPHAIRVIDEKISHSMQVSTTTFFPLLTSARLVDNDSSIRYSKQEMC